MEEKILIKSQSCDIKKILIIILAVGLLISLIFYGELLGKRLEIRESDYDTYQRHKGDPFCGIGYSKCSSCVAYKNSSFFDALGYTLKEGSERCYFIPFAVMALIGGLFYFAIHNNELTVTDKRIFGKVAWGKRVDLPVDSVSAISATRFWRGVSIATSSGAIVFRGIKNWEEIYTILNGLLIERQQARAAVAAPAPTPAAVPTPAPAAPQRDEIEQLEKYKKLLDDGVINQEEFDAKKKQVLGL